MNPSAPIGRFSVEELRVLLGGVDEAVLGVDADGRIVFATHPIREVTGEEPTWFVGRAVAGLLGSDPAVGTVEDPSAREWRPAVVELGGGATAKVEVVEVDPFGPLGPVRRLVLLRSNGRRRTVEDDLRQRIEQEEHLARLATAFVHVDVESFAAAVEDALSQLGTFVGADRLAVWRPTPDGERYWRAHAWARPGEPLPPERPIVAAGSEMIRRLRAGELVRIDGVDDLDRDWNLERVRLQRLGVTSMLVAPLAVDGVVGGFLSVVNRRVEAEVAGWRVTVVRAAAQVLAEAFARDEAERELVRRARHDPLTGLVNRWAALDALDGALSEPDPRGVAILLFDLDRFGVLNDTLGHRAGDQLLGAVAERLLRVTSTPGGAVVGRLGGDELVVVARGVDPTGVVGLARELQMALSTPFTVDGHTVFVTASVGCVHVPSGGLGVGPETVLGWADAAMYRAKARGRNRVEVFDAQMLAEADERLQIERELRAALDTGTLELHVQPEVELATGRVVALEGLLRWPHPRRGLLPASDFVPVAAESDLVVDLGRWVLREACRTAAHLRVHQADPLPVRVNVSAREIADPDLVAAVAAELADAGLPPDALRVEVSEPALMAAPDAATDALLALEVLGVPTAMDGFGTGSSSLALLSRLPFEAIAIDRSFAPGLVAGDGGDGPDLAIVRAMVEVGRALGRRVRVTGVETDAQLARARALGCDTVQGRWVGAPAPSWPT